MSNITLSGQIDLIDVLMSMGFVFREPVRYSGMTNVTQSMINDTTPGMAHWAGSGPPGKTCSQCEHYCTIEQGLGRTPRCEKYFRMMGRWGTKRLAGVTRACSHFVQDQEQD